MNKRKMGDVCEVKKFWRSPMVNVRRMRCKEGSL
jgi:hypothetical protein